MSTARTWQITSTSSDNTLDIAERIGRKMRGGEVLELVSDLGGGKTTFVRGLARGMGSGDAVRSPSFTIGNRYRAGRLTLHHFDFYRLSEPGIMRDELTEVLDDPQAVIVVEWGDIIHKVLPARRLIVHIKAIDANKRQLTFSCPESLNYLLPHNI